MSIRNLLLVCALLAAACDSTSTDGEMVDAGADFAITAQVTHVGASGTVCCLTTLGADFAAYLANPKLGTIDATGHELPSHGDLHVTNAYGQDYLLGQNVPAGGYVFSPEGLFLMYMSKVGTSNYALNFAVLSRPNFVEPPTIQVIPGGLDDVPLNQQAFFSPSGRYYIIGVLPDGVDNIPDLHLIDVQHARDFYTLDKGAFAYLELVTYNDMMVYQNSTASTVAGQPSVEGLYLLQLAAATSGDAGAAGGKPALIDTYTVGVTLMADGHTLLYTKTDKSLWLYDLRGNSHLKLADEVATVNIGFTRKGPIAYIGTDRSIHVFPKLQQPTLVLPAGIADPFSPILFSPDGGRMYYFTQVDSEDNHGVMYTVRVTPGALDTPVLVGTRVSLGDTQFVNGKMLWLDDVDASGDTGNFYVGEYDGSNRQLMAVGVATSEVQVVQPIPTPPPKKTNPFHPLPDLSPVLIPPVFANLTNSSRDFTVRTINDARALVGSLSFGPRIGDPEGPLNPSVPSGGFQFTDDGYLLAFIGDAQWDNSLHTYTGNLQLFATVNDQGVAKPAIGGVSEMGPIVQRHLFVTAPSATDGAGGARDHGVYFIAY
jgi:hypothetical protein